MKKIILKNDALLIDDEILIDARKKSTENNPKGWIDPAAFNEIGVVWEAVKKAYMQGEDAEKSLMAIAKKKFNVDSEGAEIEGGIPEHWKEMKNGKIKYR
ncbi:MAG: hypothetical protein HY813_02385 [Candidatus Portnoybacteria bacterium]|nr:hypothetical protein [Candidatus Portnoybacteria bacterium]